MDNIKMVIRDEIRMPIVLREQIKFSMVFAAPQSTSTSESTDSSTKK